MKNDVSEKLLHGIHDSFGHGVYNIFIYNIVTHNFQFQFDFKISTYKSNILKIKRKLKIMRLIL